MCVIRILWFSGSLDVNLIVRQETTCVIYTLCNLQVFLSVDLKLGTFSVSLLCFHFVLCFICTIEFDSHQM